MNRYRNQHRAGHEMAGAEFAQSSTERRYAPDLPLTPDHLTLRLCPDLNARTATVQVTHTLRATADGADRIVLNGVDFLDLTVQDPDGGELTWHYDGDRIHIRWPTPAQRDDHRRVTLSYRVAQPITGLFFGGPSPSEPDRARYLATDHETERSRYWLASVDHPSARATLDIYLQVEPGLEAVATGALVSDTTDAAGVRTVHWRSAARCPSYLLCIIIGEYIRYDDADVDGKPLSYFAVPPARMEDLQRAFAPTGEMLRYLTAKLGTPLPWAKYYQFAAPGIGGAMENISLVSWDENWLMDPRAHAERGHILDLVNLHEMAHTWFGDLVVVRDFSHAWLKESWATYMESVWIEDTQDSEEFHYQIFLERKAYRDEADRRYIRPIVTRRYDSSWSMFDRHLYPGGAVRLHLLREMVGDAAFWSGVRSYIQKYAHQVAETEDFRRELEDASGRYLARFFDEWIYGKGYPKLKASSNYSDGTLTVSIQQTQVSAKTDIGLFHFPLEVAVEERPGEWSRHRLSVSETHHALRLSLPERPLQVVIDPEAKVPHSLEFDPGQEMLKRMLTEAPWVPARIFAGQVLGKSGRAAAIKAIESAYQAEQFWGVRVELAQALGASKTTAAASAIATLLPEESDPRVVGVLTQAAGSHRDPGIVAALTAWLDDGPHPYRATASALHSLGKQRGTKHIPRLQAALSERAWGATIARGAAQGLAATREPEALPLLLTALREPSSPVWLRRVVASSLPAFARELELSDRRQVREALEDSLRDPVYGVRMSSMHALGALKERAAISALESARGSLAVQDHPAVDRAISTLRASGSSSAVASLRKQVESLSSKVQKLTARLTALESSDK